MEFYILIGYKIEHRKANILAKNAVVFTTYK